MSWATRKHPTMDPEPAAMDANMTELVEVRALRVFGLGDSLVRVGDVVRLPRHRAEYAKFLQLVEWV